MNTLAGAIQVLWHQDVAVILAHNGVVIHLHVQARGYVGDAGLLVAHPVQWLAHVLGV